MKNANITLEKMVIDYGRMVSAICRRMIQDEEVAKDAAQEVWLQVVKSFPKFKGKSKLSTWIYAIASRVVMQYAQNERIYTKRSLKRYFQAQYISTPELGDPEKYILVKEICDKCLTGVLHCLNNESRLAFILRDIIQLPYDEIAYVLNKDDRAVRKVVSRNRDKLRNFLKDECVLYNPEGKCKCRLKKIVQKINLPEEYKKIRKFASQVNLYLESEEVLPTKNYWEQFL